MRSNGQMDIDLNLGGYMRIVIMLWFLIIVVLVMRIVKCTGKILENSKYGGCSIANIVSIREEVNYRFFRKVVSYYPTYEYMAEKLILKSESSWAYGASENLKVGDKKILYYDLENPEGYVTYEEEKYWRDSIVRWVTLLEIFFLYAVYFWGRPRISI